MVPTEADPSPPLPPHHCVVVIVIIVVPPSPRPDFGAQPTGAAVPCTLHLPADDDKWSWGCAAHCARVGGCG